MSYLILVRHGQSKWNLIQKFTGWVDVSLSEKGIQESLVLAEELKDLDVDIAFTSKLVRAQQTLLLVLAKQKKVGIFLHDEKKQFDWSNHPKQFEEDEIPIYSDNALNERYYGELQGKSKEKMRKKFGEEKVFLWRRSFNERPPKGESLGDVYKRTVPYFKEKILPQLKNGKNVVVSAHGNSLRSIIKYLDNIDDENIPFLELHTGKMIIYKYTKKGLKKLKHKHSFYRPVEWKPKWINSKNGLISKLKVY
ncbi:MAG: histidine phosphatase family protein [Candidatus ainarchaeum sp.]|nr:histidine phosphatase family protein [Candidatus ainarchaeum sp.]